MAVHPLRLHRDQLARQLGQARILDIEPLVGGDDAVLALEGRQLRLRHFQLLAERRGALVEPLGVLPCRLHLQLQIDVDVARGEGVRDHRGKCRVGAGEADMDDRAVSRRADLELALEQIREPHPNVAGAFGIGQPLFARDRRLVELQALDHAPRDPLRIDDVDLGRHVARQELDRHAAARQRFAALHIHQHRGFGGILLLEHQADTEGQRHCRDRDQHDQPDARSKDQQELLDRHGLAPGIRTGSLGQRSRRWAAGGRSGAVRRR